MFVFVNVNMRMKPKITPTIKDTSLPWLTKLRDAFPSFIFTGRNWLLGFQGSGQRSILNFFFHPYLFLVAFLEFSFFFYRPAPNSQQLLVIWVNLLLVKLFS